MLFGVASIGSAQTFYVDVTNATPNAQVHLPDPGDYAYYPSVDNAGAGFSAGSGPFSPAGVGTYYIADGFLTGYTSEGLWESWWLDALHPAPDSGPHGGIGTVDVVAPGGIPGAVGTSAAIMANGLPAAPVGSGDTNGQYLGLAAEPTGGVHEYGLWDTPLVVSATTTFQYGYSWSPAGATLADGTEFLPLGVVGMGAQFFLLDGTTDYSAGAPTFAESSSLRPYMGMGNQDWFTETGTFTLDPGTYYWGFSATGDSAASYIAVEGISIAPVPEPSGALLVFAGSVLFGLRRRRRGNA